MEKTPETCGRKLSHKILCGIGIGAVAGGLAWAGLAHAGNWHDDDNHHGKGRHMMEMFERFDTNSDGRVTKDEIEITRQAMFGGADGNNDSMLTLDEFEGLWLDHLRPRMVDKFQKLDNDGDGQVTETEFAKPMDRVAGWLDKNDDGVIEMKELKRGHFGGHDDDDDEDDDD
jgi:hypothetical protein